ncbi:MAG: hypothetical protein KAV82_09335 [Phycisphaerae bacterium]|nr:hypothetical protein [Phycisphaerae bacterium]
MIFTDAHERTLDGKNRIQIPSEYRNGLDPEVDGDAFYLCPGERKNTLSLCPSKRFEERVRALRTSHIAGDESLAFEQVFYSLVSRLEMDKQGRMVLPERQLAMVNLGKEITLAGANERIDLWRTSEYKEFIEANFEQRWHKLQRFLRMAGSEWEDKT